ncbi:MAG: hypothetical protein WBB28_24720 [Crinalium sp.]
MLYRKQKGGFTLTGRYRLAQILTQGRMRQDGGCGLSLRDFADGVNEYWGFKVINKDKLCRLENAARVKPDPEELSYLAPFTWSESARRPYTVEELVAIGQEQLDPADVGKVEPPKLDTLTNSNNQKVNKLTADS